MISAHSKVAGFGECVSQISSQVGIFEIIRAAGYLAQQYNAGIGGRRRRKPGEQFLHGDEVGRKSFDAALVEYIGEHSRNGDAVLQRESCAARALAAIGLYPPAAIWS